MGVTKPYVVHADSDKPHRCPACWRVAVDDGPVLPWRVYACCGCDDPSCGCGQRFARRPWLPYFDDEPGHPLRYVARAAKDGLWMFGHRRRIWGLAAAFGGAFRYVTDSARIARERAARTEQNP
jgi:hypothetical protein